MPAICLCFHLHIPTYLKPYSIFDLGVSRDYFDEEKTLAYLDELVSVCLLPANRLLKSLMEAHQGKFKVGMALSGSTLKLLERHRPDVLASFLDLTTHGFVEFLAQNDDYTLSFMYDRDEFQRQLNSHRDRVERLFKQKPEVVMTAAGLYSNPMGYLLQKLGYKGILCGANPGGLKGRHVHQVYHPPHLPNVNLLFADDEMTNAVERDFSVNDLDAKGMKEWISGIQGDVVNLVLDYKVLGALHKESSGVFDFFKDFVSSVASSDAHTFLYPSEVFHQHKPVGGYDMSNFTTRNSVKTSTVFNYFQREAIRKLEQIKKRLKSQPDDSVAEVWQKLQDAYYVQEMGNNEMGSKRGEDAYSHFFNIISDQELQLDKLAK